MKQSHFITEKRRVEPRQKTNLLDETKVAQIDKNGSTARRELRPELGPMVP